MKEFLAVINAFRAAEARGATSALVTLVKVKGSSYRRAGARMLVTDDGQRIGAVSGGCLEDDIQRKALLAISTGRSSLIVYDSTDEDELNADDIRYGVGLGCNGVVYVLIEPITQTAGRLHLDALAEFVHHPKPQVLAVVFGAEGNLTSDVGNILTFNDLASHSYSLSSDLGRVVATDAEACFHAKRSATKLYEFSDGRAEVFFEYLAPPVSLAIFGAGYDAIPLVAFAKELGWTVTVVDGRPSYVSKSRFPSADALVVAKHDALAQVSEQIQFADVAVVMSHNYIYDLAVLHLLAHLPMKYVGVLGPKKRTDKLFAELRSNGVEISDDFLNRVYAPMGLDIGAELPDEIALSVLSEIRAVMSGRSGGHLRLRRAPIHDHAQEIQPSLK